MHPLISENRAGIAEICERHGIRRLDVFGSAARADDFDLATSDADFIVEFAPEARTGLVEFFAAKSELERLLGRGVDLVERDALRNPYVLDTVNRHRQLVYAA